MKKHPFDVIEQKLVRVIADTDCACECDDQYCVAHLLMSPKFDIRGLVAEQFGSKFGGSSMGRSYDEIIKIVGLMGLTDEVNVLRGGDGSLPDEKTPLDSEGARFIVEEAMKDDPRPLFVVNQGALTNMASAYLMEPAICDRLTAIWIGGGVYPNGGWEFNMMNDINAANVIMDSGIELWQVPMNVYSLMKVSFYELYEKVYPCGEIGKYLVDNTMAVCESLGRRLAARGGADLGMSGKAASRAARAAGYPGGENWQLGDSPVVGLMLTDTVGNYDVIGAPRFKPDGSYELRSDNPHTIRAYRDIDSRFILNDFFAKLKYMYG